ncbi:MAG: acetyl-CoA decarbonylase/synthase complex subunit gamma [Actinobacteria bacterium]|nr:acetyl-CoA decarbonylase/synthase complex subunit gamma [Actinomycetota bacterium]
MALTGLEIFKQLPRTNCKECGFPTCLAFAMKVAAGQEGLDSCPHMTDQARSALSAASAPPQRLIKIVGSQGEFSVGQETVMFRHDETFHNPTGVAILVSDALGDDEIKARCEAIKGLSFHRVGTDITVDLAAVQNTSGDAAKFAAVAKAVSEQTKLPLVLISSDAAALKQAVEALGSAVKPLLVPTDGALDSAVELAKSQKLPLCVTNPDLEALSGVTEKLSADVPDLVICPGDLPSPKVIEYLSIARRAALKKKCRPLGFPALVYATDSDPAKAAIRASSYVAKYAGIVILDTVEPWAVVSVLTTRQNIYTDPRKPVQVEPKLYELGQPSDTDPLLITTNFSLSYYSVESELTAARLPARVLAVDTEGTSVLTAWAADKFNPETITKALNDSQAQGALKHHKAVIPGHVAVISASLAEESNWEVLVGPKEASGIPSYIKNDWKP